MKKYIEPLTQTVELTVRAMIALSAGNAIGNGWHGKSRADEEEEDEEAYVATNGEGEAQYGDLW